MFSICLLCALLSLQLLPQPRVPGGKGGAGPCSQRALPRVLPARPVAGSFVLRVPSPAVELL